VRARTGGEAALAGAGIRLVLPPALQQNEGPRGKGKMGLRRNARECALQMLYQLDIGRQSVNEVVSSYWLVNDAPPRVREFAEHLFSGCTSRVKEIDRMVQRHAKHWRLGRMAAVDRNILRLAVFELLSDAKTPATVVINEALEIAKKFSTHESAQFVNGVLDSVKEELLASEATG